MSPATTQTPTLTTVLHTRIQPSPVFLPSSHIPTSTLLAIPDAATAGYSPPQAIWFYDGPVPPRDPMGQEDARGEGKGEGTIDLSTNLLLQSLARTLAAYPHFAGELEHVPFRAEVGAKAEERGGRLRVVFGGVEEGGVELLVAKCEIMIVKLTTFPCGGLAVAARLQHVLADAQAFLGFVTNWAAVNIVRRLFGGSF